MSAFVPPRILLVEDEALIALDIQSMLEDAGYNVVGPADRVDSALSMAVTEPLDAAALDVDVNGENVSPVAEALRTRNIPFLILSGSSSRSPRDSLLARAPHLDKPVEPGALRDAVKNLLRTAAQRRPT